MSIAPSRLTVSVPVNVSQGLTVWFVGTGVSSADGPVSGLSVYFFLIAAASAPSMPCCIVPSPSGAAHSRPKYTLYFSHTHSLLCPDLNPALAQISGVPRSSSCCSVSACAASFHLCCIRRCDVVSSLVCLHFTLLFFVISACWRSDFFHPKMIFPQKPMTLTWTIWRISL